MAFDIFWKRTHFWRIEMSGGQNDPTQNPVTSQLIKGPLTYRLLLLWSKNKKEEGAARLPSPCFCALPEVQFFSKVLLKRYCLTQKAWQNSRKLQPYVDHKFFVSWSRESEDASLRQKSIHYLRLSCQIMSTSSLSVAKLSFFTNLVPKILGDFPP